MYSQGLPEPPWKACPGEEVLGKAKGSTQKGQSLREGTAGPCTLKGRGGSLFQVAALQRWGWLAFQNQQWQKAKTDRHTESQMNPRRMGQGEVEVRRGMSENLHRD